MSSRDPHQRLLSTLPTSRLIELRLPPSTHDNDEPSRLEVWRQCKRVSASGRLSIQDVVTVANDFGRPRPRFPNTTRPHAHRKYRQDVDVDAETEDNQLQELNTDNEEADGGGDGDERETTVRPRVVAPRTGAIDGSSSNRNRGGNSNSRRNTTSDTSKATDSRKTADGADLKAFLDTIDMARL